MAENSTAQDVWKFAIDGPFDKPNRIRRVVVLRESDVAGFMLCRDIDTDQNVVTSKDRISDKLPGKK